MVNRADSKLPQKKLTGWKMISRHLGRSERAVQFWEEQRGLPIHRIPGGRGQTVFAYVDELDAWLSGAIALDSALPCREDAQAVAPPGPIAAGLASATRPPGILVLPAEGGVELGPCGVGDSLCQQLVVRLSAVQPVRVLSWTTSRSIRQSLEPFDVMASRLNVRYLVETTLERDIAAVHVDVRVVDGDIDQLMLADRFVVSDHAPCTTYAQIAEGVALHFALIHAGALVEPMCLGDVTPAVLLEYLGAARSFFDDADGSTGRALRALDRVLAANAAFEPARALRGLVLLQTLADRRDPSLLEEARGILAHCAEGTAARVTAAFLGAAIVKHAIGTSGAIVSTARTALRWIPPLVARNGRLYERRATLRRANDTLDPVREADERRGHSAAEEGHELLNELLKDLVAAHHRRDRHEKTRSRSIDGSQVDVSMSANDPLLRAGHRPQDDRPVASPLSN